MKYQIERIFDLPGGIVYEIFFSPKGQEAFSSGDTYKVWDRSSLGWSPLSASDGISEQIGTHQVIQHIIGVFLFFYWREERNRNQ